MAESAIKHSPDVLLLFILLVNINTPYSYLSLYTRSLPYVIIVVPIHLAYADWYTQIILKTVLHYLKYTAFYYRSR